MHNKFTLFKNELNSIFPERTNVVNGVIATVLSGEHVLMLGPPGTAKSALTRCIANAFQASYFELLVSKFTTPEEVFGSISLKALEQDKYERVIAGKLPEAQFGFIDEIFKSNSAILNSMLSIINERIYHNGTNVVKCPLISLFGASNELHDGKELEALFDRFLIRFDARYMVSESNFRKVLVSSEPTVNTKLTMSDLTTAQDLTSKVILTDATVDKLIEVRETLAQEGVIASDRRWKKSIKLIKAVAFLSGDSETSPEDLSILSDSLWREPAQRSKISRVIGKIADPSGTLAREILDSAFEVQVKVNGLKVSDRKAFVGQAANALQAFSDQNRKLQELAKTAGKRAQSIISEAQAEIKIMHGEIGKSLKAGMNL